MVLAAVQAFRDSGMEIEVGVTLCLCVSIKLIWKEAGLEKRTLEMRERVFGMEEVAQSVKCDSQEFVSPSCLQSQHGDGRIPEACYGQPGGPNW